MARLQSAAEDFARAGIKLIASSVIADLRSQPANGIFGDVAARHLWDEYCWSLQEGPFDDNIGWDDVNLGSFSDAFDDVVRAVILSEVEKLPKHAQTFLSARAYEEDIDCDEEESLGSIWMDGIVSLVHDEVNTRASRRTLDLIGPDRGDVISYEVDGSGMVWSILSDRDEAMDLIANGCDALIDPKANLSELADELVDAFMASAAEDDEGAVFSIFLEHFENEVRMLVREKDVMPSLEDMRARLLDQLDG
ncbi:hypothetical protein PUV47_11745 [Pseudovibrio exalbescens]|uniref:hypothetical protein n=1 Tax=Pseudovibrio exalbescens TaxID=197461 RepID=UPI00236530AE|nr:hypothetical protein [Pseudovibrio exalbescens]MDD7910594.1 hypothetical protein [Pseudovibrio exalbescens]